MKVKNRRSLNRIIVSNEEVEVRDHECDDSSSGRKRKTCIPRSQKCDKPINCSLSIITPDSRKSKRKGTGDSGNSHTNSRPFKTATSLQSNSCSSASSMVSGDTADPYEFAVRPDEDLHECVVETTQQLNTNNSSVPHIKKIKLDRMGDCSRPNSDRSSPFSQTTFSQPSPGANSSPLGAHCTRPLSVLTDFSGSSASSSSSISCSSVANRCNGEQENPILGGDHRHGLNGICTSASCTTAAAELPGEISLSALSTCPVTSVGETLMNTAAITEGGNTFPAPFTNVNIPRVGTTSPLSLSTPSPTFRQPCSITCSTPDPEPLRRCAGVNTILDSCKETTIEPDLLGPCEPGTTIRLNGIVWLETTTGVLVVNVTWRGRTYIGTLLDATQHDFAPPCPRDYVPPFKQSVRSSNRSKRRAGLANGYRPHYSSTALGQESSRKASAGGGGGNQRHRLRGRNTASPTSGVPTNEMAVTSSASSVITVSITTDTEIGGPTQGYTGSDGSDSFTTSGKILKGQFHGKDSDMGINEVVGARLPSAGEVTADLSQGPSDGVKLDQKKRRISDRYSNGASDNLSEPTTDQYNHSGRSNLEAKDIIDSSDQNDQIPPGLGSLEINQKPVSPITNSVAAENCIRENDDNEVESTFPITCPLDGCRKRFTHVIALRFHLNHTRHAKDDKAAVDNCGLQDSSHSVEQNNKREPTSRTGSPPMIFPPCPRSPTPPPTVTPPPKAGRIPTTENALISSFEHVNSESFSMAYRSGVTKSVCSSTGDHQPSTTLQHTGSRRIFAKVHTLPHFNGSTYDPNVPPPITRTVTAHTVSIPHGPTIKSDITSMNGLGSTTVKHRPSIGGRVDGGRIRGQCGKVVVEQPGKSEPQTGNHITKRSPVSTRNAIDFSGLPSVTSRLPSNTAPTQSLKPDNVHGDTNDLTSFATPLAPISREQPIEHISLSNQLLTLPPGVWNFSSAPESHYEVALNRQPEPTCVITTTAGPMQQSCVYQVGGGAIALQNHSQQHFQSNNSAVSLNNFATSVPTSAAQPDCGLQPYNGCNNSVFRQALGQPTESPTFYGMPNFLMAAAMSALGTSRMSNSADILRSYTPGFSDDLGSKPPSIAHECQLPFTISQASSTKSSDPTVMNSVSLVSPPQPLSFVLGSHTTPPFIHAIGSSINGNSDRLDPFKLSAAYFLQQATAGPQLPSTVFGQQSS